MTSRLLLNRSILTAAVLLCASLPRSRAADLEILPGDVTLSGPRASQRLIVVTKENGRVVGQAEAAFRSHDEKVARVEEKTGIVEAVGDGDTFIEARASSVVTKIKVKVSGFQQAGDWSFRNHVVPVLTRLGCNSGACHGALAGKGGMKLSLRGYDPDADHFVLTRQALGRRVDRQEPHRSLFLTKPTFAVNHGGGQRTEVGSPEYRVLSEWVAAGAPGPKKDDPPVTRLEVFPAEAVLKPKDNLQVVVRAWYGDGSSRDVTRWAKFMSSEEQVANVGEDGKVSVQGHGEAAVSILYGTQVASARVVSPLPDKVDAAVYRDSPKHNYIDELVLKKLEELRLRPSKQCTDEEFIRRAFLDCCGVLPTPEEVQKFLADKRPDKRARLIDALLERPEYVDYWTHKWSDLLLVSTRKLPQPAVWSFHQFVRQSVADNKPWDRFAREIVTARGSTLRNGAANYFVLHRDVSDLSETTAVTFLGTSITCARCHNHPLEKWTQDQYWGMANLFARVGLKNGDRAGEVNVQSQPEGEAPHPRRGVAMPPTPLDAKPLAADSTVDRREYFADWLTGKDNPYFARAIVNRVWRNFLGRGLVEAEDDLRATNPPSNAALLDALAKDLIDHKYDLKYLIKTVLASAAYQRSSRPVEGNATDDRFYSRYLVKRLTAEVLLDAYSQATGVPTPFTQVNIGSSGGTAATTLYPAGTRALQLPDSLLVSPFLDAFGRPERVQTCSCERQQDASVGQALHLNNGKTLNDKLRDKKSRVEGWVQEKIGDEEAVKRVFLVALSRSPTAAELKKFTGLLAEAAADGQTARREALEDLFWSVLTSKEFVFNH